MLFKLFGNLEGINEFLSLIGTLLIISVIHYYYKYFTRINPLPGPFPFPFVGNLPQLVWHRGNLKDYLELNHKKYGDIIDICLPQRSISLGRAEYIEKFLIPSTKNLNITRTPRFNVFDDLGITGKGIVVNQHYKSWRYNRQFFTQAFLNPKFNHKAIEWINRLFDELESYWNKLYLKEEIIKENKNILDFFPWLNQFTNDMIIELITGERSYSMASLFNTLSDEKAEHHLAITEDSVKLVCAIRKYNTRLPWFELVPPFLRHYVPYFKNISDDTINNVKYLHKRLDAIIKRRRQEIENTPLDEPLQSDMLTSVITASTSRDFNRIKTVGGEILRPMTDDEICFVMIDGFLAGTDTTANMISFIVYYLAHNPVVKMKMFEEIDRRFQGDTTRPITEDDLRSLKYCEAIIKEVARIFPVFHSFGRVINKPEEIAGYRWPTGTYFRINADAVHGNKNHWEEADKFNPDRWLNEGFEPKKYSFIMFGGGPRLCPGRKLAMIELVGLMALLFRKYEIDLVDMKAPLKTTSLGMSVCNELLVKISLRN
ncbi:cytochrome P450 [Rhizophagus clarus]|uniref:Cytochrome P450 n=1 Tax=Rhizophagus clarus TaxID=94130 RepID=A0A8H3KYE0_9GLOM|nr:cytochrome P450 [Rhizophagus clarus]